MRCWLTVGFQLKPQKPTTYPPFSRDRDSRPLSSMLGAFKEVGLPRSPSRLQSSRELNARLLTPSLPPSAIIDNGVPTIFVCKMPCDLQHQPWYLINAVSFLQWLLCISPICGPVVGKTEEASSWTDGRSLERMPGKPTSHMWQQIYWRNWKLRRCANFKAAMPSKDRTPWITFASAQGPLD